MEAIKRKLKDFDGVAIDSRGCSRGVAMLCRKGLDVQLLSISLLHIDVVIKDLGPSAEWCSTGLYGWPEHQHKTLTGNLIRDLHSHSHLPSLVGGDYNEIWFNYAKRGGPDKPHNTLDLFHETFSDRDLHDLDYSRYDFSWWNHRDDDQLVEERVDRYCASVE